MKQSMQTLLQNYISYTDLHTVLPSKIYSTKLTTNYSKCGLQHVVVALTFHAHGTIVVFN